MTPTKQRFQCFDAVVDKPSLTASHNLAVPHRSSLTSTHLEHVENCRCSPSSECQHAKPLSSAVSGNYSASWYQPQNISHQHASRRPMRPEGDPVNGITHHHHNHHHHQYHTRKHYKRILLVKNSNPSIQKTILLHRKPVHSLGVFLDDVSELMQCLIRKLYTLDGCKVDSVQSLLQGPGILVCVGREPFHPHLLESFQKNSEDKLPNLIFKSRSSTCSEEQGCQKNVNFGQKSKKRMPTGSFPQARGNMPDDDIEKRVIVNEDGSLSMEMKVRFRLLNDKTLHWSTEIKKSSCTFNVSFPGQDNVYYPHCGHGESCSETESLSASEADDVYVAKVCLDRLEEPQCQHCCTQCQEYDIWKNPALSEQETLRHFRSTRLRGSSHKIKCKKESVESVHTTSCEEYTEHVVEKATYIHQTVGEEDKGDNTIQYCTVSRCCSRSEVCTVSANAKKAGYTDEEHGQNDQMSVQITQASIEDERPLSVETNSSDILASLKEDEDKEETDLSLSNSRASQSTKENDKQTRNAIVSPYLLTPCKPLESPKQSLSSRTSSTGLCSSVKSKTFRKVVVKETQENVDQDKNNAPLSTPHRRQHKESIDRARESGISEEESVATIQSEDVLKSKFNLSKTDTSESPITKNRMEEPANVASAMSPNSNVSASLSRAQSEISVHSNGSTISKLSSDLELLVNGSEQTEEVMPHAMSTVSRSSQISDLVTSELSEMNDQIEDRSPSIMSIKSSISEPTPVKLVKGQSAESLKSVLSTKTNISVQSRTSKLSDVTPVDMDNRLSMLRVPSAMSVKSDASLKSKTSSILDISPHDSDVAEEEIKGRALSTKSNRSNTSSRSNTSKITPVANATDPEKERLKRPSSIMSSKSASSVRSTKSKLRDDSDDTAEMTKQLQDRSVTSAVPSETSDSELFKAKTSEATLDKSGNFEDKSEETAFSTIAAKLNTPEKVNKSDMSNMGGKEERSLSATSSKSNVSKKSGKCRLSGAAQEWDHVEERPASIMSSISVKSKLSVVSDAPCQNEEEETKQTGRRSQNSLSVRSQRTRKSIVSEAPGQGTGNEDNEERAPSAMSRKSILSDRANLGPDGVDNTGTTEDLVKEPEKTHEITKDVRAASAMSCKSQISSLSNKSRDQTPEGVPTSMLAKSNVSAKSKNSKIDQSKKEGEEKYDRASILVSPKSNMSARSKNSVSPAEEENQFAERSLSIKSGKSNASKKSKESAVVDCFKEFQNANNEFVERCPFSAKSNTSGRSKGSDTQSNSPMEKICFGTISVKSSTSAEDEKLRFSIAPNNSPNFNKVQSEETWDIKIEETAPGDLSTNSSVSSRSVKSNISALLGGQLASVNKISDNADNKERASSSLSKKSSASVSIGIVEEYDVDNAVEDNSMSLASVNSAPQLNSKSDVCCKVSSKKIENECQESTQTADDRTKSSLTARTIVSDKSKTSECSHQDTFQPITDNEVAHNKYAKKNSKKASSQSLSSKSAHSDFGSSKVDCKNSSAVTDRTKSNVSTTLSQLEVNAKAKRNYGGARSKSNLSSNMDFNKEEEISRPCSADILITTVLTNDGPLTQKSKYSVIPHDVSNRSSPPLNENGNTLIRTRDLNACSRICNGFLAATDCRRNINDHKSENSSISSCRQSSSSTAQNEDNDPSELVPSILPSSSPTEVVNEWLRKIPVSSAFSDVGDEFHESCEELSKMPVNITQYERGNGSEEDADVALFRPQNEQVADEEIENVELGCMKQTAKDFATLERIPPSTFSDSSSSVQLMRILLNPKLDRSNSLPEVSHVYGRKLSTSASGFLESLVNLQLLDFDPYDANSKAEKYNHLMNMLKSLWLCDPSDRVTITQKSKFSNQKSNDDIKSSSGAEINSSSHDSGKHRVNESVVTKKAQTNTNAEEAEILTKEEDKTDPATPDIASRVRWTPDHQMQDRNTLSPVSDFSQATDSASILSMNCGHKDKANQQLPEQEEDTSSETPVSEQMGKGSQNPDPVWVLNLLNNIEKQFMTHYVTSMAEFKLRWNLNDSEQLDTMICELRDEVHKRIKSSINNELRKIQGQAGKPRPPKEPLSRESSILTEQRRRRLKVSLNQSITDLAETTDNDNNTRVINDLHNQRNDNDYCPCDACINEKMSSRHVLAMDVSNPAPMMTDFDLRRILNLKRDGSTESKEKIKENRNEDKHTFGNLADLFLLESLKMEETQELCKANLKVQIGQTDIETQTKITGDEEEICDKLDEEKEFCEIETVREEHALEAGPSRENIAIEANGVGEQEEAEGQSTEREETEAEKSDAGTGNETGTDKASDKIESMGERKSEGNEATEGKDSESDHEELGETSDDGKEMHKNTKTETTWTNILAKHDTAAKTKSNKQEVVKNEIATAAKEEEPKSKSDGIIHPEDEKEEDDTIEAEKTKSTDNKERDDAKLVEDDLAIKKTSKESEDDLFDEERTSDSAEDEDVTEPESVEGANPMSHESTKEEETDNDELDAERKTTKSETVTDEEPGDNETAEYGEKCSDDTSDRIEVNQVKTQGENRELDNNVTTEDGDTIEGQLADSEERGEVKEDDDCESAEGVETSKPSTTEDASDDETAKYEETPRNKRVKDGETSHDRIGDNEGADEDVSGKAEIAEDRDAEDEISKFEETLCSEPKDEIKSMITENEETFDDETSDDEAVPGAVVSEGKETAEEENGNEEEDQGDDDDDDDDERAEETKEAETETEEETVHKGIVEAGDESKNQKAGDESDDGKTADETADDIEMDAGQTEEEGETADNEGDNDGIVNEGTAEETEDGDTPNDSTAEDGTIDEEQPPESDMEEVEETTETETEDHEAQEDNGIADEQTGNDEVADNESNTGTENEENVEIAEANTGEDGQTVDSGTTEDEERRADVEELSENEIAQNVETTDEYDQKDDSDTLEKRETAIKVNGETHKSYIAKNLKKMGINQEIETFVSNRYNGNTHSVNTEESDEGGDEDEDESESVVRTKARAQGMKIPAKLAAKWLQYKDGQTDKSTTASFISTGKGYVGSEDGADADGEDSETEVHNNDGSVRNEDE